MKSEASSFTHTPVSPILRSSLRWLGLVTGAGLMLGGFLVSGCGSACDSPDADPALCGDTSQEPEPSVGPCADDTFLNNVPTTWAMIRHLDQEVLVYASPATKEGWYPQFTDSVFLVNLTSKGDGKFDSSEDLCGVTVSTIEIEKARGGTAIQATGFPVDPGTWVPNVSWHAEFKAEAGEGNSCSTSFTLTSDLSTGEIFSVWGADLADPLNDKCPMEQDGPWVDVDADSHPGFTTTSYVDGSEFVNTYICQRLLLGHGPAGVSTADDGRYAILGKFLSLTNDQSMHSFDNPLFSDDDPEVRFLAPQYDSSYYYLIQLNSGATCADAMAEFAD